MWLAAWKYEHNSRFMFFGSMWWLISFDKKSSSTVCKFKHTCTESWMETTDTSITSVIWLCFRLRKPWPIFCRNVACFKKKKKKRHPLKRPQKPQMMFFHICIECKLLPMLQFSMAFGNTEFQKSNGSSADGADKRGDAACYSQRANIRLCLFSSFVCLFCYFQICRVDANVRDEGTLRPTQQKFKKNRSIYQRHSCSWCSEDVLLFYDRVINASLSLAERNQTLLPCTCNPVALLHLLFKTW